jgi:cell division protease FtsH
MVDSTSDNLFPIIILIAFLMFIMNQSQGGGGRVMRLEKAKPAHDWGKVKVTFKDVAGAG